MATFLARRAISGWQDSHEIVSLCSRRQVLLHRSRGESLLSPEPSDWWFVAEVGSEWIDVDATPAVVARIYG